MNSVLCGHALEELRKLPDNSVDCVVTSPPYWGLRDYGTPELKWPPVRFAPMPGLANMSIPAMEASLGLEQTPEAFVGHLVQIFREVRRVLKPEGTCWVNLGDSYAGNGAAYGDAKSTLEGRKQAGSSGARRQSKKAPGLKPKDLCMMPARLALALEADGWWLRQDIVWNKPNPMPESVQDRCTKSHEYLFLLTKSKKYFWNAEAIKEPVSGTAHARADGINPKAKYKVPDGWDTSEGAHGTIHREGRAKGKTPSRTSGVRVTHTPNSRQPQARQNESFSAAVCGLVDLRNRRSVWTMATQGYPEAHFATFPEELPRTCILAGCPEGGVVLDPFAGSGTTLSVALSLGRQYIGIELNPGYLSLIEKRLASVTPPLALWEAA